MFSAVKNLTKAIMGYPAITKTKDPRYTEAKKNLIILQKDTEKLIGTISQMLSQLREISSTAMKIGVNLSEYAEAEENQNFKNEVITIESFGKAFDYLTANFLSSRLNPLIIKPLALFQHEVNQLIPLKDEIKNARNQYDYNRTYLQYYIDHQYDENFLEKWRKDTEDAQNTYNKLNEDFIERTKKLMDEKSTLIDKPSRIFISVLSQYLLQLFQELQKFRTTFPKEVIDNTLQRKRSIISVVFEKDDEPTKHFQIPETGHIFQ